MKTITKLTTFIAISFAIAGSALAEPITTSVFATADTYVRSGDGQTALNFGGADQMLIGNHATLGDFHGFLRFDLSSLPTNIEIQSVTLQMVKPANGVGLPFTVNIFELSAANANWVEGTANAATQSGSATWGSKGPSAWAGSAGASTAGTDYTDTVLASYGGTTVAGDAAFTSQSAFLTVVGSHLGGSLNLGIAMNNSAEVQYYRFATTEHATAAASELEITYTVIPETGTAGLLLGAGCLLMVAVRRRVRG